MGPRDQNEQFRVMGWQGIKMIRVFVFLGHSSVSPIAFHKRYTRDAISVAGEADAISKSTWPYSDGDVVDMNDEWP